jgi:hypothetical protein
MDYINLTLAELRNGISDTKSAIHRCKEALDNLRQPKTVGLQAMADAITRLLPKLEQDLKALEKAYTTKSVSRGQQWPPAASRLWVSTGRHSFRAVMVLRKKQAKPLN